MTEAATGTADGAGQGAGEPGPVSTFDDALAQFFDLAVPQPKYKAILQEAAAIRPVDGFVLAASRAAVDEVLRSPDVFTSRDVVWLGNVRPLIPLSVDPPDHAKYRKILDPLFAPKRMDAIERDVAERVNHFIDAFVDRGSCNFTEELAVPFPSSVFLGLMGLPWDELETFLRLKDGILRPGGGFAEPEERTRIQNETAQEIYAYFNTILDERQRHPKEDILTLFLQAEVAGERLSREEILDICFLFLIAGLDTVRVSGPARAVPAADRRGPRHRAQGRRGAPALGITGPGVPAQGDQGHRDHGVPGQAG
jgi:cytochrome P450